MIFVIIAAVLPAHMAEDLGRRRCEHEIRCVTDPTMYVDALAALATGLWIEV